MYCISYYRYLEWIGLTDASFHQIMHQFQISIMMPLWPFMCFGLSVVFSRTVEIPLTSWPVADSTQLSADSTPLNLKVRADESVRWLGIISAFLKPSNFPTIPLRFLKYFDKLVWEAGIIFMYDFTVNHSFLWAYLDMFLFYYTLFFKLRYTEAYCIHLEKKETPVFLIHLFFALFFGVIISVFLSNLFSCFS